MKVVDLNASNKFTASFSRNSLLFSFAFIITIEKIAFILMRYFVTLQKLYKIITFIQNFPRKKIVSYSEIIEILKEFITFGFYSRLYGNASNIWTTIGDATSRSVLQDTNYGIQQRIVVINFERMGGGERGVEILFTLMWRNFSP